MDTDLIRKLNAMSDQELINRKDVIETQFMTLTKINNFDALVDELDIIKDILFVRQEEKDVAK